MIIRVHNITAKMHTEKVCIFVLLNVGLLSTSFQLFNRVGKVYSVVLYGSIFVTFAAKVSSGRGFLRSSS